MTNATNKGFFITFEGGEGVGKSTQATLLYERLVAEGYAAHLTREPGGTPLANGIRALVLYPQKTLDALAEAEPRSEKMWAEALHPDTEALLMSAARRQHVVELTRMLSNSQMIVVCDRFSDATYAYQGYGRGVDRRDLEDLERIAARGLRPDLTFLLQLEVKQGQRRKERSLQPSLFADADAAGAEEPAQPGATTWESVSGAKTPAEMNRLDRETRDFHQRVARGYATLADADPARWIALDATKSIHELAEEIWREVAARLEAKHIAPQRH
jgi:dTMP kinase